MLAQLKGRGNYVVQLEFGFAGGDRLALLQHLQHFQVPIKLLTRLHVETRAGTEQAGDSNINVGHMFESEHLSHQLGAFVERETICRKLFENICLKLVVKCVVGNVDAVFGQIEYLMGVHVF